MTGPINEAGDLLVTTETSPSAQLRQGVVTAVDLGNASITVTLSGDTANPVAGVRVLERYSAAVGDTVWLVKNGTDLLCIGRLGGNLPAPVTTASAGTPTTTTAEIRDDVLGTYQFYATGNRWYRACVENMNAQSSGAAVSAWFKIRDGGASAPTSSSTVIADTQWYFPIAGSGTAGRFAIPLSRPYLFSAGVHTIALLCQVSSGTGVITPTGDRAIYVQALGM